jgi:glycosyltransferase involved in cell wall biosynthesis
VLLEQSNWAGGSESAARLAILRNVPQTRPRLTGAPAALFVFSNLREQKGGLTRAWLRRLALFDAAGWDTHVATVHPQPEIDETLVEWRARGLLPQGTQVHHYQRRNKRFRPSWSRANDQDFSRDDRLADWLDWLVGLLPGAVVFADSPVSYAPLAKMTNPYVGKIMSVHLSHRQTPMTGPQRERTGAIRRTKYAGPAGQPKLSTRFLPYASSASAVVALTSRQARHLEEDVPGLRVNAIPNIIDPLDLADPPIRDPLRLVMLGRLEPLKRVDQAIMAVALAAREVPGLHLDVYGRGPDQEPLEELCDELGAQDLVTFAGFTEDPNGVLAGAAATLMTSRREGFGLTVAESLAVGTPVLSYDIDYGPVELIADRVNGRLVPDGSVEELAAAIVETVRDPEAWRGMSEAGPPSVQNLAEGVVGAQWLALAAEVADGVEIPEVALLVEDLAVRRTGLDVSGVVLTGESGKAPQSLVVISDELGSVPDLEARVPLEIGGDSLVREASATLPWAVVDTWEPGAGMWAVDDRASLVPTTGPGIPTTVVPGSEGPVLLTGRVDERGVVRRLESGAPVAVQVSDGVGMANVDGDLTVLSDLPVVRVRIVGSSGPLVDVEVAAGYPGLELSPGAEIAVVVRRGDGMLQVGTARTGDHTGRWTDSLWTIAADLDLDRDALTLLDAERGPSLPLLVGLGRTLRSIGPVGYGAGRPLPVTVEGVGRWTLAPSAEGAALLVPGTALRARVASRLRRS